jgi:hypothetical protein
VRLLSLLLLRVGCTDNEGGTDTDGIIPDTGPFDSDGDRHFNANEEESNCAPGPSKCDTREMLISTLS